MSEIRIVFKRPGFPAEVRLIENTLESLQAQLDGGCLEGIALTEEILGYADDEGLLKELPVNIVIDGQPIVGPVIFSKIDEGGDDIGFPDEAEAFRVCQMLDERAWGD